jgi:Family of unknown function (DUF5706)
MFMGLKITTDEASEQLNRVLDFFARTEVKTSALFAVNLGMLGIAALNTTWTDIGNPYVIVNGTIFLILMSISFWYEYWTLIPELRYDSNSLIYFGHIAALSCEDYLTQLGKIDQDQYIEEILKQVWRNSQILSKKFIYIRRSFLATAALLPIWLIYLTIVCTLNAKLLLG